jgi:hypothetical protein
LAFGHVSNLRLNRATSPRRQTISAFSGGLMRFLETLPCGIAMTIGCDDDEAGGKRSLFCALQKAAREILGEYQHRNVALQEVRFAIQDATRDRQTETAIRALRRFSLPHRLMDFNNLPETRFEDVKQVLRVASERVAARLEKSKQ